MPVSPQCPQKIVPLPLLPLVLQGTAISSESFSQLPPGNVVALRGWLHLKTCLEQLDRPSLAGYPFQGTELAVQSIPEASLERLVPLVHFSDSVETSAKCISMGPAHCRKRVQDSVRVSSASVQRGISHPVGPRAGSGNGTRSRETLEEGGHRCGPSSRLRARVLQPLLHCSEEGWRSASDSRSKTTEPLSHETVMRLNMVSSG